MDRRYFVLKALGAVTVGLKLSPAAAAARSCKVIGIGGAGCNFVQAASRSGGMPASAPWTTEFIGIDLDRSVLNYLDANVAPVPGGQPIRTLALATQGAAGRVNRARAAALRNREALTALLADTDLVFLVAGLGGGTGSGVTPILARLAREAGALSVAAVMTPLEFEGDARSETSFAAIRCIRREADVVLRFSNQALMDATGDRITQDEFFDLQNQRIAVGLRGLMEGEDHAPGT